MMPAEREAAIDRVLAEVRAHALRVIALRDDNGWPEPRTVEDLRRDPRVLLRNTIPDAPAAENLGLAAALIVVVEATR